MAKDRGPHAPGKGPPEPSGGGRGKVAEQGCELASAQEPKGLIRPQLHPLGMDASRPFSCPSPMSSSAKSPKY